MTCGCKVGSVAERRGIEAVAADLGALWTDEDEERRRSVRELTAHFNRRVLEAAMLDAGMSPLSGEAANLYRLLTDEETGAGDRVQAEKRLERAGVAVDGLRDDFVTHQTVYRHLRDCLDAEYDRTSDPDDRLEGDVERIESLRSRTEIVAEEIATRLRDAALFDVASPSAYVDVRIRCEDCGESYVPRDILAAEGCACPDE